MNPKKNQDPQVFVLQTLMFAMMASVGIFFFLSWQQTQSPDLAPAETPQTELFSIMAIVMAAMSFLLPKLLTPKNPRDASGKQLPIVARLFVPTVMSFALSESVAIFGFLTANQTKDFQTFLPFGITAFVLMFMHRLNVLRKIRYEQKSSF